MAPEYGMVVGKSAEEVQKSIRRFRAYGTGCDLAVCVSDRLADYVRKTLGLSRVVTISNGSDLDMFRPDVPPVSRVERLPDRLNVVWIGSADLRYNDFSLLREAANLICARGEGRRIQFNIIGKGLGRLREMPANVVYHGPEDYDSMPHWLAAMDVGLCLYREGPSDYQSPLKLFDYMASGIAVVSTRQPQVCEVFERLEQTDLLFAQDDALSLAAILSRLANERDRVRRLGDAGRRLVVDHYNWRRAVRDTFTEIASLRASTRGQRAPLLSGASEIRP